MDFLVYTLDLYKVKVVLFYFTVVIFKVLTQYYINYDFNYLFHS